MKRVIGIDLGGTNIVAAVMEDKKIISEKKIPTDASKGANAIIDSMASLVNGFLEEYPEIKSVGIGTPGSVDQTGLIHGAKNIPGWEGTNLYSSLKNKTSHDIKYIAANDVDAAAMGEDTFGNQKPHKIMLFVALGTGIGGGLVINKQLYTGVSGMATEIGHMVIEINGRKCTCGRSGCFETYASATGIKRTFLELATHGEVEQESALLKEKSKQDITAKDVYDYAKKGDVLALQATKMILTHLAEGLGNLANMYNPDLIVIGGGVSLQGDYLFAPLREEMKSKCFEKIYRSVEVTASNLQDRAGIYGACALAMGNA